MSVLTPSGAVHESDPALEALAAEGWLVLRDLHWPGRWAGSLELVLVGPGGVVVVGHDGHDGRAADVASLLFAEHRRLVRSVDRSRVPAWLVEHVRGLPRVLDARGVRQMGGHLRWQLAAPAPAPATGRPTPRATARRAEGLRAVLPRPRSPRP